jgi:hypothetical protein
MLRIKILVNIQGISNRDDMQGIVKISTGFENSVSVMQTRPDYQKRFFTWKNRGSPSIYGNQTIVILINGPEKTLL